MKYFDKKLKAVNIGVESFANALKSQNAEVFHVDWKPPAGMDPRLVKLLTKLDSPHIEHANQKAIEKILTSDPVLVDVKPAFQALPEMEKNTFLHPGPPIEWKDMCGTFKGALIGAVMYEGLAESPERAERLIETGGVSLAPCHDYEAVSGMAGIISASRPLFEVENKTHGNRAYCCIREGVGKALRFGVHSEEVIRKLQFAEKTIGPAFKVALKESGGIELGGLIARALHMGDDGHSRCIATTLLFNRIILTNLVKSDLSKDVIEQVATFLEQDEQFCLNIIMPACKATMDAAHGIENSTIVTVMTRNGTEFGIRVSGLGDRWFISISPSIEGLYFPGYGSADASPDMGDSSITETFGIGAFAMAAAPTAAQLKASGSVSKRAIGYTKEMYEITTAKNSKFTIPSLDFEGIPTGIDTRKTVETGISPIINTAIAHKEAGIGMIGLGIARAPIECFKQALGVSTKLYL